MSGNNIMLGARRVISDEFYTRLEVIEREAANYRRHFRDKVVLCNCDDPRVSSFFRYFALNFGTLGLRKLIATCYKNQEKDLFSAEEPERAVCLSLDIAGLEKLEARLGGNSQRATSPALRSSR